MRYIRYGMATLLVAGMASLAYAGAPAPNPAPSSADGITGYAAAPAAGQEVPKPKQEPAAKPPRAEKPMAHPKMDKAEKNQQKEDKKKDKAQAKEAKKDHKQAEGKKIPDKDLKAHFGQSHKFAVKQVITTTHIVPNQTRFVYSGYTFIFVDPWPMGWGFDDDCYIDYVDGGYYMFDPMHPGVQVTLMIAG